MRKRRRRRQKNRKPLRRRFRLKSPSRKPRRRSRRHSTSLCTPRSRRASHNGLRKRSARITRSLSLLRCRPQRPSLSQSPPLWLHRSSLSCPSLHLRSRRPRSRSTSREWSHQRLPSKLLAQSAPTLTRQPSPRSCTRPISLSPRLRPPLSLSSVTSLPLRASSPKASSASTAKR